jgi:hypothetical protein
MYRLLEHYVKLRIVPHKLVSFQHRELSMCAIVMPYLVPMNEWAASEATSIARLAQGILSLATVCSGHAVLTSQCALALVLFMEGLVMLLLAAPVPDHICVALFVLLVGGLEAAQRCCG